MEIESPENVIEERMMQIAETKDEDYDESSFNDIEEEDISSEPSSAKEKSDLQELREEVKLQEKEIFKPKFARVESKPEFASEIINAESSQKVANLDDGQICELLEKRKFINLLNNFGWGRLAKRVLDNVVDVENYSLSKDGFLPKQVFTESSRSAQYNYDVNNKKRDKKEV